jgi:hypothetical protein
MKIVGVFNSLLLLFNYSRACSEGQKRGKKEEKLIAHEVI